MKLEEILDKIYRKVHRIVFEKIKVGKWIRLFYPAYIHSLIVRNKSGKNCGRETLYLTEQPNRGAGIGHQMANWNAGYWYAKIFCINYAYSSFSSAEWDKFLGFGEGEITAEVLRKKYGYKKRRLPYYYDNKADMEMINKIITSYQGRKVIFYNELDQPYSEQYGVGPFIKKKFNDASARERDSKLIYNKDRLSIAVHIRRGDIALGFKTQEQNLLRRWLTDEYYIKVIEQLFPKYMNGREYDIYLFSQGEEKDFSAFTRFKQIKFCLDMSAQETFLHMVRADILVSSKSSFSYKAALLSDGIKVCPENFWHGYPKAEDWMLVQDDGTFC